MPDAVRFWVAGVPAPGGSKRGFIHNDRVVMAPDCRRTKPWMKRVAEVAARRCPAPLDGPLVATFAFVMPRPKYHLGQGRNAGKVKASAPKHHVVPEDVTKLVRSTEDALRGICYEDDSSIVEQHATKRYGMRPGVLIEIRTIETEGA